MRHKLPLTALGGFLLLLARVLAGKDYHHYSPARRYGFDGRDTDWSWS